MSNLNMPTMTFEAIGKRFFSRRGDATRRIAYNTTATFVTDGVHIEYLIRYHGNPIAWIATDEVAIDTAGWGTTPTRARLNAVLTSNGLPYAVVQRQHQQVLVSDSLTSVVENFRSGVFDIPSRSLTSHITA